MRNQKQAQWTKVKIGEVYLMRGNKVLATIRRLNYDLYEWNADTRSGTSKSEYAAMRAVRRALKAQEGSNDAPAL